MGGGRHVANRVAMEKNFDFEWSHLPLPPPKEYSFACKNEIHKILSKSINIINTCRKAFEVHTVLVILS